MPLGPGKYDALASYVREQAKAEGVAVIIIAGDQGNGFSVQASGRLTLQLPALLRFMADEIERKPS